MSGWARWIRDAGRAGAAALALASALPMAAQAQAGKQPGAARAAPTAPAAPTGPLLELPPQVLGPGQCALFLWERAASARRLVMISAAPAFARVMTAAGPRDLAQTATAGEPRHGVAPVASFADSGLVLRTDLRFEERQGLVGGALAREGTLSIEVPGGDTIILPVAGILGCR